MKIILGIALSLIAILDLVIWLSRKKISAEAIWNIIADIIIIAYTIL